MALFFAQTLTVEGILIFDNQELTVEWPDHFTDVDTIPGGAAGVSPGARKCTITASNALRREGADFDFEGAYHNATELECVVQQIGSNQKVKGKFLVREIRRGSGVGQPSIQSLRLQSVGDVPKLE